MLSAFLTPLLARHGKRIAFFAGCLVAFLAWDSSRVNHGIQLQKQATETANVVVVKRAGAAASKSSNPHARGVLDPNSVAE